MIKLNYLNLGCGSKFHTAWTNIDMRSTSPHVQCHDLRKGLPFPDNTFDVIYQSQVLEHFPKDKAPALIDECFRTMRAGGTLRVVVPDLENIAKEYLRLLQENIDRADRKLEADYDWILLELYDQTVRNRSGGEMQVFLENPSILNEAYVTSRVGAAAKVLLASGRAREQKQDVAHRWRSAAGSAAKWFRGLTRTKATMVGDFRLAGEVHLWMYDRFSLARLLKVSGFDSVQIRSPFESGIPAWADFELDVRDGEAIDPTSLFIEARKPNLAYPAHGSR